MPNRAHALTDAEMIRQHALDHGAGLQHGHVGRQQQRAAADAHVEHPQREEQVHVLGRARHKNVGHQRAGDLEIGGQRRRLERDAHAGLDAAAHHLRRCR